MLIRRLRPLPVRSLQRGAHAVLTVAVLGCLVLLNVLGARHHRRWDLSRAQSFSLAAETVQVLAGLPQAVEVVAFADPGSGFQAYLSDLLKAYAYRSGGTLRYRFVDPEAQPGLAAQYGVTAYNTVVVSSGQRRERIDAWDFTAADGVGDQPQYSGENALTNALIRLTQARQRKVYFLSGHEERDGDLGLLRKQLGDAGYAVESVNLVERPALPLDADTLVIAGPRRDLSAPETEVIGRWADDGGRVLLLADPAPAVQPQLAALAARLGVRLGDNLVVDPGGHYRFDSTALVPQYGEHPITDKTQASQMRILLPQARSLAPTGGAWEATPLLQTSAQAWGQAAVTAPPRYEAGRGDVQGPLPLAAALERKGEHPGRAVVVGSAAFAGDAAASLTAANLDFVLDSVDWLADKGGGVAIRPRAAAPARLFLTGPQAQFLLYAAALALPLVAMLAGGAVWLRRRHL